jgi:hypothetical protein
MIHSTFSFHRGLFCLGVAVALLSFMVSCTGEKPAAKQEAMEQPAPERGGTTYRLYFLGGQSNMEG